VADLDHNTGSCAEKLNHERAVGTKLSTNVNDMLHPGIMICGTLALFAVVQAIFALAFVRLFAARQPVELNDDAFPKAAVLVPLRGADPKLRETLVGLLRQDYPAFEIHVVVDNPDDPAWQIASEVARQYQATNMRLGWIEHRRESCGLQCSALVEAMEHVSDDCQIIVGIDGDVLTHSTWLRELVAPFRDARIGVTHGNRWFMPEKKNWGGLVRYLWNAAALPPMHFFGIPWGGTVAIRASALRDSGLLDNWSRAIVHDAPAKKAIRKLHLKVHFVPSLMMTIRENCDLAFAHDFIKRQMMWTRIYHPNWGPVFLHALATSGLLIAAILVVVFGIATRDATMIAWAGGGLAGYLGCLLILLAVMEAGVRRSIARRGEPTRWLTWGAILRLPAAILLTTFVYLSAVLLANFRQRVTWRGVTYHVRGPFDVVMERDVRMTHSNPDADVSL